MLLVNISPNLNDSEKKTLWFSKQTSKVTESVENSFFLTLKRADTVWKDEPFFLPPFLAPPLASGEKLRKDVIQIQFWVNRAISCLFAGFCTEVRIFRHHWPLCLILNESYMPTKFASTFLWFFFYSEIKRKVSSHCTEMDSSILGHLGTL